jgi:acetoin utilization deacetylase AcuC-like enzyme
MLLHSGTYRALTLMIKDAAARLCGGRLAIVHEGGYAEAYVPFCGQAILEALSGQTTAVEDPELEMFGLWQPSERVVRFHKGLIDELAAAAH